VLVHDLVVEAGHPELAATALHHDSAERQFRTSVGSRDLAKLAVPVEREVAATASAHHAKEAVTV